MLAGSPSSYAFHDSWLMTGCNNVACPGWGGDTRAGDADAGPSMINKYCDLGDTETRHYNVTPDLLMWPLLPHNQPLWARCGDTHPWWPCCLCGGLGYTQIFRALIWYWDHLKNFIAEIPQGPLGMSIGTIWVTQKRFQGPPARGFWFF